MRVAIEITAAVVEAQDKPFELQTLEIDEPGPGEVLVRLVATGVCHTDGLARHGDLPFPFPGVLGHEGAGIVEAVGPGVTEFARRRPGRHRLAVVRQLPQLPGR